MQLHLVKISVINCRYLSLRIKWENGFGVIFNNYILSS